jgi:3-hydroxyacyl-CoA dehydrogenase
MKNTLFQKIGIVGSGRMGEDIFYHLNDFDYSLVWIFRKEQIKKRALEKFNKKMKRLREAGALDGKAFNDRNENTLMTLNHEDLKDCDLIIEAIAEDAEMKSGLFRSLDRIVNRDCVFVSNSSSIKPSRICPDSDRKRMFAGLHFFFPVRYNALVEIIGTDSCSPQAIGALKHFTEAIAKRPLVLPEEGAFILNKVIVYSQAPAFWALKEKVLGIKEIDALVKKHVFSMGIFEFLDHVGLDVVLSSARNYLEDIEDQEIITATIEEVQKKVDRGNLGIKSGRGFYRYREDKGSEVKGEMKQISSGLREIYENDLMDKISCLYINCSYGFIDRGYVSESELDAALSEYRGVDKGPVMLGHEIGFDRVCAILRRHYRETGKGFFNPSPSLLKRAG